DPWRAAQARHCSQRPLYPTLPTPRTSPAAKPELAQAPLRRRFRRWEVAMEDRRRVEALFRYSLIRELADPELRPRRRGVTTRALAELEHLRDDGRRVRVSPATLRRWLRYWCAGGFDAPLPGGKLLPQPDAGGERGRRVHPP